MGKVAGGESCLTYIPGLGQGFFPPGFFSGFLPRAKNIRKTDKRVIHGDLCDRPQL